MSTNKPIRRVAIIGTGVIGASWTALYLAKGLQVVATDIAPNAEASLRKFVETAWPALKRLGLSAGASQSNLKLTAALAQAVDGVDLVQENGPERIDFKQKLYGQLDELLPPEVIIASSSSGLTMSEIQKGAASHPERCVIAHPFNLVGGAKTSEATIGARRNFTRRSGSGRCASTRKCRATSPTACRLRWRARFITSLPRVSSAPPTSTPPCAGGRACAGASWAT